MHSDQNAADVDVIDLRLLVARLAARRWWVIASVALCTVAFTAVALVMRPVYRASSVLAPANIGHAQSGLESMLGELGGLAALAGINLGNSDQEREEALAVLRSRQFTESFFRDEQVLSKIFSDKWDAASGQWKSGLRNPPTNSQAYRYFDKKVRRIIENKKTGLVTLEIDWTDREDAARWANELVKRLNAEMRARAIASADTSVKFLERELTSTNTVEVRTAINRLIEAQVKQRMLASVNQDYAFRVVDRAVPPDVDDPVSPNKLIFAIAGFIAGFLLSLLLVFVFDNARPARARRAATCLGAGSEGHE